jgi:hypothetical protein
MFRFTTTHLLVALLATVPLSCLLDRSTGGLQPTTGSGGMGQGGQLFGGGSNACSTSDDCPAASTQCQQPSCEAESCGFANLANGTDCEGGGQCLVGACVSAVGQACTQNAECFSDLCIDFVCCGSVCDDLCSSCAVAGSEGTCSPEPSGVVAGDDCMGGACDGLGQCLDGVVEWGHAWGSIWDDSGRAIASGPDALFTAVRHDNTITVDSAYNANSTDFVVVKTDPDGVVEWVYDPTGGFAERVEGLGATADGGAVVVGRFEDSLFAKVQTLQSDGSDDGFAVKLAANGTPQWAYQLGGAGFAGTYRVAAHATEDRVAIGGWFTGEINFGGADPVTTTGGFDGYIQQLGPNGAPMWRYVIEGAGDAGVSGIAYEGDELVFAGSFGTALDLDVSYTAVTRDLYLARLDAQGVPTESVTFSGSGEEFLYGMAAVPGGGVVLVGSYSGALSFGNETLPVASGTDAFVVRLDGSNQVMWAKSFNATTWEVIARGVAVDPAGNVVIGGSFAGSTDFGSGLVSPSEDTLPDGFVVKLGPDGAYYWHHTFGGTLDDIVNSVAVDANGRVSVTGHFNETIVFDGPSIDDVGFLDAFVAQLSP